MSPLWGLIPKLNNNCYQNFSPMGLYEAGRTSKPHRGDILIDS